MLGQIPVILRNPTGVRQNKLHMRQFWRILEWWSGGLWRGRFLLATSRCRSRWSLPRRHRPAGRSGSRRSFSRRMASSAAPNWRSAARYAGPSVHADLARIATVILMAALTLT